MFSDTDDIKLEISNRRNLIKYKQKSLKHNPTKEPMDKKKKKNERNVKNILRKHKMEI